MRLSSIGMVAPLCVLPTTQGVTALNDITRLKYAFLNGAFCGGLRYPLRWLSLDHPPLNA